MLEFLAAVAAWMVGLGVLGWLDDRMRSAGRGPGLARRLRQLTIGQVMLAIAALAWVFAVLTVRYPGPYLFLAALAAAILFIRAWIREFADLMGRPDDAFPGRFDKLIWAAVVLAAAPIGVWMYRAFRRDRWPEPAPAPAPEVAGAEPGLGPA